MISDTQLNTSITARRAYCCLSDECTRNYTIVSPSIQMKIGEAGLGSWGGGTAEVRYPILATIQNKNQQNIKQARQRREKILRSGKEAAESGGRGAGATKLEIKIDPNAHSFHVSHLLKHTHTNKQTNSCTFRLRINTQIALSSAGTTNALCTAFERNRDENRKLGCNGGSWNCGVREAVHT